MEVDAASDKTGVENNLKRSAETNEDTAESLKPDIKKPKTDSSVTDSSGDKDETTENCSQQNSKVAKVAASHDTNSELENGKSETENSQKSTKDNSEENISDKDNHTTDSMHQNESENTGSKSNDSSSSVSPEFTVRMKEVDVGITEYLGSLTDSFSAVIKQRYSDFIVNEIDEDGNVVHLKKITHEEEKEDDKEEEEGKEGEESQNKTDETSGILSETDLTAIQKIVNDLSKEASHTIAAPQDKALRTKIHMAVKQRFSQMETSTTEDEKGNKVIKVAWRKGKSRNVIRDEWPQSKKSCRYVRFVLYKENKDTMDAIGLIAKNLRVREGMFQYAGSKDKRAKTTQEITAHRIHPKKLVNLNKVLWNMGLGDFRYVEQPLQLGQLSGNRFTIVLRNIQASREVVNSALTSLKVTGFINYFGMQRFGTTAVPTHRIGSALLKGDWDRAIDLILAPRNDLPAKDKFQTKWAETKDPWATLALTPRFCGLERNILEALGKKQKPFNALERLPRNTRLLYLHSYQSLVWNKMASKRLTCLGHGVVPGDLVMDRQPPGAKGQDCPPPVVVTEANASSYKLMDVVLPLPGFDVLYPNNAVGDWYKDLLSSDGLDIDNMKRSQKDYSLSGAYRHLVVIPQDVSWSQPTYDDYTLALTRSDLDLIKEETLHDCGEAGSHRAVVLHMSLPSSCYATMALREAMRIDTSSFHQASLNQATS